MVYGALGKGASRQAGNAVEPRIRHSAFAANQGQFQIRYVGRKAALPSLTGDPVGASYLGGSATYNIKNGKIVTDSSARRSKSPSTKRRRSIWLRAVTSSVMPITRSSRR